MAKDAKGHGSDARGANTVDTTFSSKGVGAHGKGMYARLHSGQLLKLNPAATDGRIPRVGSELDPSQHTSVMPAAHQTGVTQATTGFNLRASASENPRTSSQDYQERSYRYNGSNSKAAINWGLKKIQTEFPDHRRHSVEMAD